MIEVKDIHKGFGGTEVLKGISTTFQPGKTSLIIGQSGSGKTVSLKSLIGLHTPEGGTIAFDGRINTQFTTEEKDSGDKKLGWYFKEAPCLTHKQEENVVFPLKMFTKQSDKEMLDRVNTVLKRVNLENSNTKFPAEL